MLNQPRHSAFDYADDHDTIGPGSASRFRFLAAVFVVGATVVLLRIAFVQTKLQASYLRSLDVTTIEFEALPARDGRILTDTDVLAADVDQYAVEVHYRWLQDPVDDAWLQRQVRDELTREERRDEKLVAHVEADVLQRRTELWNAIKALTKQSTDELQKRRQSVQARVTRIAESVNRRHSATDILTEDRDILRPDDDDDGPLMKFATAVRKAVTEPPTRSVTDRIIVREEEDFHAIVDDVPLAVAAEIREHPERFPGVRISAGTQRTYPHSRVAPHIVGARTPLSDDEIAAADEANTPLRSATWTPRRGRFGVELSYERRLSGTPGLRKIVRNRRQEIIETVEVTTPAAGRDVVLTLNLPVQKHAEELLREALGERPPKLLADDEDEEGGDEPRSIPVGGSVVVMDVQTGRILAAASAPNFDLSLFLTGLQSEWDAANNDSRRPFVSRVTAMALPPGSVFKPLTAVAAMEHGTLDPDATFHCQGFLKTPNEHRCLIFRLYGAGHEDLTLRRALAESCNVYFFTAAQRTGIAPLVDWSQRFGFGRPTGVDLPFEKNGTLPASGNSQAPDRRFEREALGLAIGQSQLTVTPLQIARMMAAVANGGWLVTPHVVSQDGIARTAADIDDSPQDNVRRRIPGLHESTLEHIREGLTATVQEPYGSAFETVRLPEVTIAGKTGTAETAPGKPDHAWFAGYVPADHPRYAVAVVLEHGGSGSRSAGPVVREVVRKMLELGLL